MSEQPVTLADLDLEAIPERAEALSVEFVRLTDAEIDAQIGAGPEHIAVVLRQAFREGRYRRETSGDLYMILTNQECIAIGMQSEPRYRLGTPKEN